MSRSEPIPLGRSDDPQARAFRKNTFKKGSTTYFNSSLFFPADVRAKVFVLYAFVRRADDFVDAVPQDGEGFRAFRAYAGARLSSGNAVPERGEPTYAGPAHTATERATPAQAAPAREPPARGIAGDSVRSEGSGVQPEDQRVVDDFVDLARKEGFDPLWTRAFLDSMEADLHRAAYDTLEDTLGYIYGSAEVIGLFMSRLMGLPAESFQAARLLGRAMQYINFIRDVAEDRTLGRRYLPLNGFDPQVVEPEWAQGHAAQFSDWLRSHLGLYRQWQEEALAGFPFIPYRYRIAVAAAADMYWWTAATIERNPLVVFEKKVKPRRFRIYSAILRNAMMGAVFTPRRA